jgi:hypothetical protein
MGFLIVGILLSVTFSGIVMVRLARERMAGEMALKDLNLAPDGAA